MRIMFIIFCLMLTSVAYADDDNSIESFDRKMQQDDQEYNTAHMRRQLDDIQESQQKIQEQLDNQPYPYLPYPAQ